MTEQVYRNLAPYPYVRVRTEIYLGSREPIAQPMVIFDGTRLVLEEITYVPALFTYFREILDNALDEVIGRKRGKTIRVHFDPIKLEFEIEDDGAGIPIEHDPILKGIPAVVLLSNVQAGSNFDETELRRLGITADKTPIQAKRGEWAGANGVGGSVVNFTSEYFRVDIWRDGKHFGQTWTEGANNFRTTGHRINEVAGAKTGTRIQFKPSAKVYKTPMIPERLILSHIWMVASTNADKLKLYYNGNRIQPKKAKDPIPATLFPEGNSMQMEVDEDGFRSKYYLIPSFTPEGETVSSLVNCVPAFNGGTHIDSFKSAFYTGVIQALESRAKKERLTLKKDDISTGLLIFNATTMRAPDFDSQTKSRLQNPVGSLVRKAISADSVLALIKSNKEWAESILERCRIRLNRKAVDTQKATSKTKVAKLTDANSLHRMECILFVGEGDSAVRGGLMNEHNSRIHGILPLRGKIPNVHDLTIRDIPKIEVYRDLSAAIGLIPGKRAIRTDLRYKHTYLATDEDHDGNHITTLGANFFYKFWPELFEPDPRLGPFLWKFCTPLIIARKASKSIYFYDHNISDYEKNPQKYAGWDITYAKGLGTLKNEDWRILLSNPTVIPFINDPDIPETFDLIFNKKRADDRKNEL